jgi:hypothetical protein
MLIKNALTPMLRLCGEWKSGSKSAIYHNSLYFFKTLRDQSVSAIDQNTLILSNANNSNAAFVTGLCQTNIKCCFKPPANNVKIKTRNKKTFIKAMLIGMNIIKVIAQKKAAELLNS